MDASVLKVLDSLGVTIAVCAFLIVYQLNGIKNAIRESNPLHRQYKELKKESDRERKVSK